MPALAAVRSVESPLAVEEGLGGAAGGRGAMDDDGDVDVDDVDTVESALARARQAVSVASQRDMVAGAKHAAIPSRPSQQSVDGHGGPAPRQPSLRAAASPTTVPATRPPSAEEGSELDLAGMATSYKGSEPLLDAAEVATPRHAAVGGGGGAGQTHTYAVVEEEEDERQTAEGEGEGEGEGDREEVSTDEIAAAQKAAIAAVQKAAVTIEKVRVCLLCVCAVCECYVCFSGGRGR
jgi:hypothetical protein